MINHLTFPLRSVLFSRFGMEAGSYHFLKKREAPLSYGGISFRNANWGTSGNGVLVALNDVGGVAWDLLLGEVADWELRSWLDKAIAAPIRRHVPAIICENYDTRTSSKFVCLNGQMAAPQAAVAKFLREICGIELDVGWELEEQVEFGGVYMYRNHIVICQRPSHIEPLVSGRRHRDGGSVIEYQDGFGFFALNNVIVPQWLAVGKADHIDPALFATIGNVDVRREFLRKVGIERIYQKLGGIVIDRQGDYELVKIDLGGVVGMWPYLKMKNPSIGVWHLEAVPERTTTVNAALIWRNGTNLPPSQLT